MIFQSTQFQFTITDNKPRKMNFERLCLLPTSQSNYYNNKKMHRPKRFHSLCSLLNNQTVKPCATPRCPPWRQLLRRRQKTNRFRAGNLFARSQFNGGTSSSEKKETLHHWLTLTEDKTMETKIRVLKGNLFLLGCRKRWTEVWKNNVSAASVGATKLFPKIHYLRTKSKVNRLSGETTLPTFSVFPTHTRLSFSPPQHAT